MRLYIKQRGDILIMTLLMLVTFMVIVAAWAQFAARQSHVTIDQEQEEQAFGVAEAGLERTLFLLNSGVYDVDQLINSVKQQNHEVTDPSGGVVGDNIVLFADGGDGSISVTSLGYDANIRERCQQIDAVIDSFDGAVGGTRYYVREFDHDIGTSCLVSSDSKLNLTRTPATVQESNPPAGRLVTFSIRLSSADVVPVEVTFGTDNGTAEAGEDFADTSERVRFEPGETLQTVPVQVHDDSVVESTEYFWGRLEDSNADIQTSSRWVRIQDDD